MKLGQRDNKGKVNKEYITMAFVIWDNLLRFPAAQAMILEVGDLPQHGGQRNKSPFDSPYKLQDLIRAVGDNTGGTKMLWVLDALRDLLIQGLAEPGEFSIKNLTGKGIGNKGTVHVLMVKQQCMDYVTDELAEEMRLDVDTRARLRQMRAGGHDGARKNYLGGPITKADKTWIGFLPPSGQLVIRFVSENVYGLTNDWAWKAAVKGGKSAKDAMEQSPFQSMIAETKTLREGELGIQAPGDGDGDKNEQ